MKFLDFFAGIGGFHAAFNRVGWDCLGYCEIDKFARQSYKAIHNTEGMEEWHDITRVSDDDFRRLRGRVDIIAGGFPCQAFSVSGKQGGFEDTRGTLFFEIARAAQQIQPRFLLLENVKNLISHDKGRTFSTILRTLYELGYGHIEWGVFNSKYWGSPQSRERVYIIAELIDVPKDPYLLPVLIKQSERQPANDIQSVLESGVEEKYYLPDERTADLIEQIDIDTKTEGFIGIGHHPFSKKQEFSGFRDDISPCLLATDYKAPKTILEKTKGRDGSIFRIRKITPLECWRLQNFTDEQFQKAVASGVSNTQLYKQAGNSVTVKVVEMIARQIQTRIEGEAYEGESNKRQSLPKVSRD